MGKLAYEFIDPDKQILSPDFRFVENYLKASGRTEIGWHYITDITWLYSKIKQWPRHYKILDVGGGSGPLQFLLAELGFNITNIDLVMPKPSPEYTRRYHSTFEIFQSLITTDYANHISVPKTKEKASDPSFVKSIKTCWERTLFRKIIRSIPSGYDKKHDEWRKSEGLSGTPVGSIRHIRGNICSVPEIASGTFDAVVSLSAIEHIPKEALISAIKEIHRILKLNARWAITTSGTEKNETWFHEPSQGLCLAVPDVERYFDARPDGDQHPLDIMVKYQLSQYLKNNLADFYKESGRFGMPWGIWDPKYIPIGIYT